MQLDIHWPPINVLTDLLEHDSEMNRMMEAIEVSGEWVVRVACDSADRAVVPFPTGDRSETPVDLTARRHSVPISRTLLACFVIRTNSHSL